MRIEHNHRVGKAEAVRKIDAWLDDLLGRQFPGGIAVKDVSRNWSDNTLSFSCRAKKGFLGTTLSGVLQVNDDTVVLHFDPPGLVTTLVSEDEIRDAIHKQLDGLFPA